MKAGSSKGGSAKKDSSAQKRGFFGSIALFVRQVVNELSKVVTPTRKELINFTVVVLVFVVIMILITTVLDFAFGWGVGWLFGGKPSNPLGG